MITVSTKPSILVVEEDATCRADLVCEFVAAGMRAVPAEDAASAMEALSQAPDDFSLVVTDLDVMPIGGFTLARAIHRRYAQVPVAIVTTRATTTMAARALARGVTLLPRPVEVAKLVQAVHKLVSPGRPSVPLAVLSETGTSFVPLRARSSPMPAARLR